MCEIREPSLPLRALFVVSIILVLTGCASIAPDPEATLTPPTEDHALAFQYDVTTSPVSPTAAFGLPKLSVYGDGSVIRDAGPQADTGQPAWPAPLQQQLSPDGVARLLDAAAAAGLADSTDFGTSAINDAPVNTFTVPGQVTSVVIVGTETASLTSSQHSAQDRLKRFVEQLGDLDAWFGDALSESEPYTFTRMAVFARPQEPSRGAPTRQWPLGDLDNSGDPHGGGRCVLVSGADLEAVQNAASEAVVSTAWYSADRAYHLTFRPLLPDEKDCAALS